MTALKLMGIFAHPDDETLGAGGMYARYAAEGVETYLVCATRGERGWNDALGANPGLEALGKIREAELMAAARVLGIREVNLLDYVDGDLDQANHAEAIAKITTHIRRVRPQVLVTFSPDGAYGHPDHIAICQFAAAALLCAADSGYADSGGQPPHRVAKVYYQVDSAGLVEFFESLFDKIEFEVDGVVRRHIGWDDWMITTKLDCTAHWRTVVKAALCHATQIVEWKDKLEGLSEEEQKRLWGNLTFYRALSLVNGGRKVERDLFEGVRTASGQIAPGL
jgi:LmbE family N-acetylglucosaminyl deacetylase